MEELETLKLERSPLEILVIELPEGGKLRLEIMNPTVKESKAIERELVKLEVLFNKTPPEITTIGYSIETIKLICKPFDEKLLDDLEPGHITQIAEGINKRQTAAVERKKKANSSKSLGSSKSESTDSAKKK